MTDEYQGTPSYEAPDTDLSPTLDSGTQDSGPGPDAGRGTEEMEALRAENEQLKNRVSQGTRTYQENQRLQQELQSHNERINRWKSKYGVDLDELERTIDPSVAAQAQQAQAHQQDQGQNVDDKLYWHGAMLGYEWEKKDFFKGNPDFNTKEFKDYFDMIATAHVRDEINQYGRPVSTPEQVRAVAEKGLKKHVDAMEQRIAKRLTETRTKVKGQGVVESGTRKPDKTSDDDESKNMTNDDYMDFSRSHTDRIRSPRL